MSNLTVVEFNPERSLYYKAKQRDLARKKEDDRVVKEDALFIHHYGMSAYIELVPAVKGFGVSWHEAVLQELENIRVRHLGQELSGFYMASAATKDKKANRHFKKMIRTLTDR